MGTEGPRHNLEQALERSLSPLHHVVQTNLPPLRQLFAGGAQGYVGGTDDAGVVASLGVSREAESA